MRRDSSVPKGNIIVEESGDKLGQTYDLDSLSDREFRHDKSSIVGNQMILGSESCSKLLS